MREGPHARAGASSRWVAATLRPPQPISGRPDRLAATRVVPREIRTGCPALVPQRGRGHCVPAFLHRKSCYLREGTMDSDQWPVAGGRSFAVGESGSREVGGNASPTALSTPLD